MLRKAILIVILFLVTGVAIAQESLEKYFFTNFSAGALTRKLDARLDFQKIFDGARTLENMMVYPQGGAFKRPGTKYVSGVSDVTATTRLVPFVYSTEQAYILEFGDGYIGFYKDQGQIVTAAGGVTTPYTISSSYDEDDLIDLKFTQSADYLYIASPSNEPAILTRSGHTSWTLTDIVFNPPPTIPQVFYPASAVTPAETSGAVLFTATAGTFLTGDVDRQIVSGTAKAIIKTYISSSAVTCETLTDFTGDTAIAQDSWYLNGSPTGTISPDKIGPVGALVGIGSTLESFRATDVGSYISVNGGFIEIKTYSHASGIYGEILSVLDVVTASAVWSMRSEAWANSYPSAVQFFEERLGWSGSTEYPQTIWLSVTNDFQNYTPGTSDSDAISVTMASNQVNAIRWMKSGQALAVGTSDSEWTLGSFSTTDPITPTDIKMKKHTSYGSSNIDALNVGRDVLYIQRGGRKLRDFGYNFEVDGYMSNDLAILSEQLFSGVTISELAYQQEPYGIVWALRSDGDLLGLTYLPDQKILAWHHFVTDGDVESIAVIPGLNNVDELWMIVEREIGSGTSRYVEFMEDTELTNNKAFYVDSGLSYSGTSVASFTGLDHLTGATVQVLADGIYLGEKIVVAGGVTTAAIASDVHMGLKYTAILETVDIPTGTGLTRRVPQIVGRFYESSYAKWGSTANNLDVIDWSFSGVTPYTGDIELNYPGGWGLNHVVYMQSDVPLPLSVSGILVKVE